MPEKNSPQPDQTASSLENNSAVSSAKNDGIPTTEGTSATKVQTKSNRSSGSFLRSTTMSWVFTAISAAIMGVTWFILVRMQPTGDTWESLVSGKGSTIALVGFGIGAIIAAIGVLPTLPARTLALIPFALVINIVLGQFVGTMPLPLPLYLDSIGTVLIAALAGSRAGMTTGVLSALVWGVFNPTVVPFAADYALIGLLAGVVPWTVRRWVPPIAGVFVGILSALMAAPIANFIYGGTAGTGTGFLVTAYKGLGFNTMQAVYLQSMTSDPVDKLIVFTLVVLIIAALPVKTVRSFASKKN